MGPLLRRTTRTALITAVLVAVPAVAAQAAGGLRATAASNGSTSVTSGTWQAVAARSPDAPYPTAPLRLDVGWDNRGPQYFWVVNTGTLPLRSVTYSVVAEDDVRLEACSGRWNTHNDSCAGRVTTMPLTASAVGPLSPGGAVQVRLTAPWRRTTTVAVSVRVSRSDVRAAQVSSG